MGEMQSVEPVCIYMTDVEANVLFSQIFIFVLFNNNHNHI